jgi:hypothetical protein
MTVIIQGSQTRALLYGAQVLKGPLTPPNSGVTSTLYTVAGGAVLVTAMVGRVTTALSGTTGTIALGTAPTVGTASTTGIATATVVGAAEIGTILTPQASSGLGGALVVSTLHAGNPPFLAMPFVVNTGTITITTGVATMTGQVQWYLHYVPLDNGASVS